MAIGDLILHNNFSGDGAANDNTTANKSLKPKFAIDSDGVVYAINSSGVVHHYDSTGTLIGTLGTFSYDIQQGEMQILEHPTAGRWLVMNNGPSQGTAVQLMAINAPSISAGTVTNYIITGAFGLGSGGNTSGMHSDAMGNVWVYSTDAIGANVNKPRLTKITLSGTTISAAVTDLSASLYPTWVKARGVLCAPDGTLILATDDNVGTHITAKLDASDLSTITSNTSIGTDLDANWLGANGHWVARNGLTTLNRYDTADLSLVQSVTVFDYGISNTLSSIVYESQSNSVWALINGFGYVFRFDLDDPSPTGLISNLTDPDNHNADHRLIMVPGQQAISPDGTLLVTGGFFDFGGTNKYGFLDFWDAEEPACLELSTDALTFSACAFGPNPDPQTVDVTNPCSGDVVAFTDGSDAAWLAVTPGSGNTPATLTVSVDVTGLTRGTYTGHITVSSVGLDPAIVTITFTVNENQLSAVPSALGFVAKKGGSNPSPQQVGILNALDGSIPLAFTLTKDEAWFTVEPTSGTTPLWLTVSVDITGLDVGTYAGHITVSTGCAIDLVIPVTLTIDSEQRTYFKLQKLVVSLKPDNIPTRGRNR